MESLFETSKWASEILYPDSPSAQYFFDDYWTDQTPNPVPIGTKCSCDQISQSQQSAPVPTGESPDPAASEQNTAQPSPLLQRSQHDRPYQYAALLGSPNFQAWKRRLDISGNIYHCPKFQRDPSTSACPSPDQVSPSPDLVHIFQAAIDHGFAAIPASPSPEGDINLNHLTAMQAAMQSTEDVLSQSQMLKAPDRAEFEKVQIPEIRGLEKLGVFQYHNIRSLPKTAQLLNSIWSYRRKRKPFGELLKYKSRICTDGSQQKFGIDFWETYAPVVNWSTVRLVLVLSAILNLHSCQVDFTQAFPQAPLSDPVFLKIPQGWYVDENNNLQKHTGR